MGICWYCHWGWPEQVAAIYEKYVDRLGESGLDFGPGHIVWSDENFNTDSVQWCIDHAVRDEHKDLSDEEFALAVESLREMLAIPQEIRDPEPANYDDENPENFPPPATVKMVRKY